jgi:molybdopterin-containing oxidoreductase family iron-sulfur binding subunit
MVFGDLNDPESKVSKLAESDRATRLLEELGTKPKVFYLERGR